jgi:hypothetical protein
MRVRPMGVSDPLHVDAGDLAVGELLDALDSGRHVVVRTDTLGGHEVTLRHDGTTYYCDTPTTLHRHEDPEEMRRCLERMGYGRES